MSEQHSPGGPGSYGASHWDAYWQRRREVMLNRYYHDKPIDTIAGLYEGDLRGKRVLEIGAGSGADIVEFAHLGAEAYALDLSPAALDLVSELVRTEALRTKRTETFGQEEARVCIVRANTTRLPFDDEFFDVVYHLGVLEHFPEPVPILGEQIRTLRPGGHLLVDVPQTFTLDTLRKNWALRRGEHEETWETAYTIGQLASLLESQGLTVVATYARSYDFRPLLALRQAHKVGLGFLGKETIYPLLPGSLGRAYNRLWNWFESRKLAYYVCWCIAAVGRKQ